MELLTPLAQTIESPLDSQTVEHGVAEAEGSSEPSEFDAVVADDEDPGEDSAALAENQPQPDPEGGVKVTENLPESNVIEEIMNRWSGVTGAFHGKVAEAPAEIQPHEYSPEIEVSAEAPVEDEENLPDNILGEDAGVTPDEGDVITEEIAVSDTPVEETEIKAETAIEVEELVRTASQEVDPKHPANPIADEADPADDGATLLNANTRTRTPKTEDATAFAKGAATNKLELNEALSDDLLPSAEQRVGAPKVQAPAAQLATLESALANNTKVADLSVQPRNLTEIGISNAANLATESRTATVAPPLGRQIADAVITATDKVVEVRLAPEELGRVRMVLTGHERSPHLTIWAERPETLEQMRRHSAGLMQELSDAGMTDATLDFRDGRHEQAATDSQQTTDDSDNLKANAPSTNSLTHRLAAANYMLSGSTRGIDIRV